MENLKSQSPHMTKRTRLVLLFLFTLVAAYAAGDSLHVVANDTLHIHEQAIDQSMLKKFKADTAFQYGRPQEGISPWQRFLVWVLSMIGKFLYYTTQTLLGKILFYSLLAGILLWVIFKLLNIDTKDLFYRNSASSSIDFKIAEENIHELDFDKLIENSVQKKEYRDAVRLTFLYSLKKLSDSNVIHWLPGKTNDDYLKEVNVHASLPRLQELRYYFDYAWYGHFEINQNTYEEVKNSFQELKSKLE